MKKLLITILLGTVLFTACGGSEPVSSNTDNSVKEETASIPSEETKEEAPEPAEEEPSSTASFKDNTLVTDQYTIKITDYKIIPPGEEGNEYADVPVIAFWYDTTNTSGDEIDPSSAWIFSISAIQDNDPNMINTLNVASLPDRAFLDTQTAIIKKDGTVSNACAYELTDETTPVTLVATNGFIGDEIGRQDFDIK